MSGGASRGGGLFGLRRHGMTGGSQRCVAPAEIMTLQ